MDVVQSWLVIGVVVGNIVIEKILHLFLRSMGRDNIIRKGVNLEKHYFSQLIEVISCGWWIHGLSSDIALISHHS